MRVNQLLSRLKNDLSVFVAEKRDLVDGTVEYILETNFTFYPHAPQKRWYTLVLEPNQDSVEQEEIEAILRRFWHSEIDVSTWLSQDGQ